MIKLILHFFHWKHYFSSESTSRRPSKWSFLSFSIMHFIFRDSVSQADEKSMLSDHQVLLTLTDILYVSYLQTVKMTICKWNNRICQYDWYLLDDVAFFKLLACQRECYEDTYISDGQHYYFCIVGPAEYVCLPFNVFQAHLCVFIQKETEDWLQKVWLITKVLILLYQRYIHLLQMFARISVSLSTYFFSISWSIQLIFYWPST